MTQPDLPLDVPDEAIPVWRERAEDVVLYPDPGLRMVAKPIPSVTPDVRTLVTRMREVMKRYHGVGLAAPQVGESHRLFIYKLAGENQPLRVVLNPRIVARKGEQVGVEGCLSIPLLQGDVQRYQEIVLKGLDVLGRPFRRRATGFEARVIQHEVDHLDGVLFIDKLIADTVHWLEPDEYGDGESGVEDSGGEYGSAESMQQDSDPEALSSTEQYG